MKSPEEMIRLELTNEEFEIIARSFICFISDRMDRAKTWDISDVEWLEKQAGIVDSIIAKTPDFQNKDVLLIIQDAQKILINHLKKQKNI